jgi:RimJ/RimL family protein N-acetyltransferase
VEIIETERLVMRRPRAGDAHAIFTRYASDPEATRYMAWPTSRSVDVTVAFVRFCDALWTRWPQAWGRGYATEALLASVEAARAAGLRRLEASVHVDHAASCHVLEKAGFVREGVRAGRPTDFPNLPPAANRDAALYALAL